MEFSSKKLFWLGSAKKDLKAMPGEIQDSFGYALHLAQTGKKHEQTKPLKGFGSAAVLEVVENASGGTYRAVYTVKFKQAIYGHFYKSPLNFGQQKSGLKRYRSCTHHHRATACKTACLT